MYIMWGLSGWRPWNVYISGLGTYLSWQFQTSVRVCGLAQARGGCTRWTPIVVPLSICVCVVSICVYVVLALRAEHNATCPQGDLTHENTDEGIHRPHRGSAASGRRHTGRAGASRRSGSSRGAGTWQRRHPLDRSGTHSSTCFSSAKPCAHRASARPAVPRRASEPCRSAAYVWPGAPAAS